MNAKYDGTRFRGFIRRDGAEQTISGVFADPQCGRIRRLVRFDRANEQVYATWASERAGKSPRLSFLARSARFP